MTEQTLRDKAGSLWLEMQELYGALAENEEQEAAIDLIEGYLRAAAHRGYLAAHVGESEPS
jgi:hypothetical protein